MSRFSALHIAALAIGFAVTASATPARADSGPVFVVPSRPGVPIAINGRDASWSVVEGDIGLSRPGHLTPVIIIGGGRPLPPRTSYDRNPYYPRFGTVPARGRNEVDPGPDRPMPEPAESFSRSWSTSSEPQPPRYSETPRQRPRQYEDESEHLPATIDDGQPPLAPPIVVAPCRGRRP